MARAGCCQGLPTLSSCRWFLSTNGCFRRSLQPNAFEVLPDGLAGIVGGLERLKNNQVSAKKLVARPQETPA